jgi:predicted Fe-Mo cluster-binding NifX family protein
MKVGITSAGTTLEDRVDPRFGRCAYFIIVETDDLTFEVVDNSNTAAGGGAGIQSAQLIAGKNVQAVCTGNCGPNAHRTLHAAGVDVFVGISGTVREAVEQVKSGSLEPAHAPSVEHHFGSGPAEGVQDTRERTNHKKGEHR